MGERPAGTLSLQLQSAMFYPNAYINFNQNGEYTKHYYNGSERIASRLGEDNLSIAFDYDDMLEIRKNELDERFRLDMQALLNEEVPVDNLSMLDVSSLQQTGSPDDIFYYHTNHLGSTAFVTDQSQNITQGFLYAPFGEITTEYNANFGNNVLPKYSFNAKELDEETGMYYYEARYYKPPVFTSRDPMFEKYFWMTPYAYCANNPVKYVDPTGEHWVEREVDGRTEVFYDRRVTSQKDVNRRYGKNSGVRILEDGASVGNGQYTVFNDHVNNKDGVVKDAQGNVVNPDKTIIYGENYTLFTGVTDQSLDPRTLRKNLFGSNYIGPRNPKTYGNGKLRSRKENYDFDTKFISSPTDLAAYWHDMAYNDANAKGILSAFFNLKVLAADEHLVETCRTIKNSPFISEKEKRNAKKINAFFTPIKSYKKLLSK